MSPTNQFQRSLTLSNTALTHDQYTFTVDIYQYTMNGNARCQLAGQKIDCFRCHIGCRIRRSKDWDTTLTSDTQHFFIRLVVPAHNDTWHVKSKKLAVTFCPHLIFQTFQIRIFHHTDNLNPFFCKMFKIACQLQSRTVDFRRNDHSF